MAKVHLYRTVGKKYGRSTWKADYAAAKHVKTQATLKGVATVGAGIANALLTHKTRELGAARPKGRVPIKGPPSRIVVRKGDVTDWYIALEAGSKKRALYIEGALGVLRGVAGEGAGWARTGDHPGDAFGNRRRSGSWGVHRMSRQAARRRARRRAIRAARSRRGR